MQRREHPAERRAEDQDEDERDHGHEGDEQGEVVFGEVHGMTRRRRFLAAP